MGRLAKIKEAAAQRRSEEAKFAERFEDSLSDLEKFSDRLNGVSHKLAEVAEQFEQAIQRDDHATQD